MLGIFLKSSFLKDERFLAFLILGRRTLCRHVSSNSCWTLCWLGKGLWLFMAHGVACFPGISVTPYLVQLGTVGSSYMDGRDGTSDHRWLETYPLKTQRRNTQKSAMGQLPPKELFMSSQMALASRKSPRTGVGYSWSLAMSLLPIISGGHGFSSMSLSRVIKAVGTTRCFSKALPLCRLPPERGVWSAVLSMSLHCLSSSQLPMTSSWYGWYPPLSLPLSDFPLPSPSLGPWGLGSSSKKLGCTPKPSLGAAAHLPSLSI